MADGAAIMLKFKGYLLGVALTAAAGVLVSGCSSDLGFGSVGTGTKEALLGKSNAETPDLQERRPLVMPPQNATLPVPGQASQPSAPTPPAR
jgi:hypothetical protein